jgi:hypothetical protein
MNTKHTFTHFSERDIAEMSNAGVFSGTSEDIEIAEMLIQVAKAGNLLLSTELFPPFESDLFIMFAEHGVIVSAQDFFIYKKGLKRLSQCDTINVSEVHIQ